jgi:hypothetical protein
MGRPGGLVEAPAADDLRLSLSADDLLLVAIGLELRRIELNEEIAGLDARPFRHDLQDSDPRVVAGPDLAADLGVRGAFDLSLGRKIVDELRTGDTTAQRLGAAPRGAQPGRETADEKEAHHEKGDRREHGQAEQPFPADPQDSAHQKGTF